MPRKSSSEETLDFQKATKTLYEHWQVVTAAASKNPDVNFVSDPAVRESIHASINHRQVTYRFCLPIQLLGKMTLPSLDCLRLQKKKGASSDVASWDARSLGSKVIAPFNKQQENILGTSGDPYVGNPMRIPRMARHDPSKKDVVGWNVLVTS